MKIAFSFLLAGLLFLSACNHADKKAEPQQPARPAADTTHASFFPVTAYLKGQINSIPALGITPLKYTIINDHIDSVWLKENEYPAAFAEFLTPVIDSANLTNYFKETNFTDLSYDSTFTFTYDPQKSLPDTFHLRSWIVYVEPTQSKVKRIYMVKNEGDKELKLTWQSDKWCSIVTIKNNADGSSKVEKEERIVWSY